jgi:diketogulonate reductase-like aldo/keto reductase
LLDFCREHGIVLLAFAALGHGLDPKLLDDPVITAIAQRVHKTPAQVALAWAVQRGHGLPDHLDQTSQYPSELRDFEPA